MGNMYDVIVVGAGPAGLMAARTAAENGLRVALLERKTDIPKMRRLDGGAIGNGFGAVIPARVLFGAEVGRGEDFLHAQDLHAGLASLLDEPDGLVDIGLTNGFQRFVDRAGHGRLDQATLHHLRH